MFECVVYGERCSGTNYLENIIKMNFDVNINYTEYGWKHFFGFLNLQSVNTDNILFICIVRNPVTWLSSLYINPYHLCLDATKNTDNFLNVPIYSNVDGTNEEIMSDRNIYTGNRYNNIFELRHTKLQFMFDDLPNRVKHCIIIKYEDLLYDFNNTINRLKLSGLNVKKNIIFPINTTFDFKLNTPYVKKEPLFSEQIIYNHPNFIPIYEKRLGYI